MRATLLISLAIVIASPGDAADPPVRASGKGAGGAAWSITTLDDIETGFSVHYSYTSVAVDQDGHAHISYRGPDYDLRYATNESGVWQSEVVQGSGSAMARESAITLDSAGQPHISFSYYDGGGYEDLRYATKAPQGAWKISTVSSTGSVGLESDISLDAAGYAHISHYDDSGDNLLYSTNQSGDWVTEILDDGVSRDRTTIEVDSNGLHHVVYKAGSSLIHRDGFDIATLIDPAAPGPSGPDLAIDANDHLHVLYSDGDHLKYATNAPGFWRIELVAAGANSDRDHSMVLDASGRAHVSYRDTITKSLVYATNTSGAWASTIIDSNGDVGYSNSIAVDDDAVWISYRRNEFPRAVFNDIWGFSSQLFIVGDDGIVVYYDAASWHVLDSGTGYDLLGVWGNSPTDVYAVGDNVILKYDGASWTEMDFRTGYTTFYGIWGSSPFDIFVVGSYGTILHYDGIEWAEMASGVTASLYGIWGSSSLDVYIVGSSGTILRYDGNTWSTLTSGTTSSLYGIWGYSPLDIFVVGASGTILGYDGDSWTAMDSDTTSWLNDIHGSSPSNIYAVGSYSGRIVHFDGISWGIVSSPVSTYLNGVWAVSLSDAFAVGEAVILHSDVDGWGLMNQSELRCATGEVLGANIFSDDFESGDVSAWSQVVP